MLRLSRSAMALSVVLSCGSASFAQQAAADCRSLPKIIDLGTLGGTQSQANAISLTNFIAGSATVEGDAANHAFLTLLRAGQKPVLKDLGVLPGGTNSSAAAVNLFGEVVGYSDYNDPINGPVTHGFVYKDGQLADVGTLGGAIAQATGVDAEGIVVGFSLLSDEGTTHGFWYDPARRKLNDLGTLPGGSNSQAFAINIFGKVAGSSDTGRVDSTDSPITDAVVWDLLKNHVTDLGTLGGSFAQATAINNLGVAAGFSTLSSDIIHLTHAFVVKNGKLADIGSLGGTYSQANAINDGGVVVGFSNTTDDADVHAFVWTPSKGMVDLNTLIPASAGWDLQVASGINVQGEIVGYGLINGEYHAFALNSNIVR